MQVLLKPKKDIENIILTEIKEMREQGVFVGTTGILSEERFKNDILNTINRGGIISKVWIKEVSDNYKTSIII